MDGESSFKGISSLEVLKIAMMMAVFPSSSVAFKSAPDSISSSMMADVFFQQEYKREVMPDLMVLVSRSFDFNAADTD